MMRILKTLLSISQWIFGVVLLGVIIAYLAGAFTTKIQPGQLAYAERESINGLETTQVQMISEPLVETSPATIAAQHETAVSARIMATIEDILVRAGDHVQSGSPLVRLDSREIRSREQQAREQLMAAQAQYDEAALDFERISSLFEEQVVARNRYDQAESGIKVAAAQLERAREALREAQIGQTYAQIDAPISGRVVDRLAEPGDTTIPGQPLLKLYSPSDLQAEAYVRESLVTQLERGSELAVEVQALGQRVIGRIVEIVPQANPGARSFLVKISLPVDDNLFPGMFARVLVQSGTQEVLYLPKKAVRSVGQLNFVTVVDDDRATGRRMVRLGHRHRNGMVQILSGVKAGDRVVVYPE